MTENIFNKRINAFLGVLFLMLGAILTALVFADRWTSLNIRFPAIWYRSRNLHVLICVLLYAAGWWAHRCAGKLPDAAEALFQSVRLYSKPNCELCDRAKDVLDEFAAQLPTIEVIDITGNSDLEEQHATSVPVVEIDGRIRFRGIVSAELMQRMIAARQRQKNDSTGDSDIAAEQGEA